jgi:hypothetical protein
MIDIRGIGAEYRIAAVFAVIAFFVTILGGIIAGVSIGVVVFRVIVSCIIFGGLGFGVVYVLKNYVPEVMDLFTSQNSAAGQGPDSVEIPGDEGEADVEGAAEGSGSDGGFTELSGEDFPRVSEATDTSAMDESLNQADSGGMNAKKGKLGKHIISDESKFQYEPKLMAQAVRTMMKRDE